MESQKAFPAQFSFEFFPPRTEKGVQNLDAACAELVKLKPAFCSVTFGAGGSTQDGTRDTIARIIEQQGIEAAPHLSCIGSSRERLAAILDDYAELGVKRIVALRGDLPSGVGDPGEFRYATELVEFIRQHSGDRFHLEVAAYPEFHPQAVSPDADFDNFKRKIEAGGNAGITQYFYNPNAYEQFINRCEQANLAVPVVPGIMPINNHKQLARFSDACGAEIPRWIRKQLEAYGDDSESIRAFGLDVVTKLCADLLNLGAPGLHFYTLNRADTTKALWNNLTLPS